MKQRVAIARALAMEPAVLLMDEPFAALDAMMRDHLHCELEALWQQTGLTVVFVTHNVREAVRLGDRVVLLSSRPGRLLAEYAIDIERPRRIESPEVARTAREITDRLHEAARSAAHA
jgi:NitT/TauT family transport system ATP-binding protein